MEELSKIKDADRYEAVTTYLAGLFSQNPSIKFLTTVRHIAQNFLLLLGNDQRGACIQKVFLSILKRSDLKYSEDGAIQLLIPKKGEFTLQGSRHAQLLFEAFKASSDKINPQPTEFKIPDAKDKSGVELVTQLIQLHSCYVHKIRIEKLNGSIAFSYLSPLISSLKNYGVGNINLGQVVFTSGDLFDRLLSILSIPSLQSWAIDFIKMDYIMKSSSGFWLLAEAPGQGSIKTLTVGSQHVNNWVGWGMGRKAEVESVKKRIDLLIFDWDVYCDTDEEVKTLCAALALAQKWRIERLYLPDNMGAESWMVLRKVINKGKVDNVNVSKWKWKWKMKMIMK